MSGSISSLGSSQIANQISTVEARLQKPITQLQTEQTGDKAVISAWGTIQGTVSSLATALAGIKDITTLNNRAATSTLTTVATATATNTALPATYNLTAVKLAKSQEIYSGVLGSGSAKLGSGSGSLTITLKGGKPEQVSVGAAGITLNGLSQAINKLAGGVQASVVGTAGGARLVLQGSGTGSSKAFSIKGTGALAKFDYSSASAAATASASTASATATTAAAGSGSFVRAQTATNASFNINGVPVSAATNTITTAVSGVTIALAGSGATTVNVSSSPGVIAGAVGSVATSLNAAIAAIAKQTAYVPASSANAASASSAQSGPLLGNYTASDLTNQLLSRVSSAAASGQTSNTIGLKVSSTGTVSFDSATFAAAYAANPTGVTALVNQIYKNLTGVTTAALGSAGTNGTISAQDAAQTAAIASLQTEITSISKNNASQLQILLQEYTVTESASTSASITESYLSIFTNSGSSTSKG